MPEEEGLRLLKSFDKIWDPNVRRHIVELVEQIEGSENKKGTVTALRTKRPTRKR
jgi:hypothetical protein